MSVLTSQQISSLAVGLLTRDLVLPGTVSRIPGGEFAGSNGDTITVRVPQPGTHRVQATPGAAITYDDVNEVGVNVSLSHLYHAKKVTDEEMSFDIENFGVQVTRVQTSAVATGAENLLAAAMNGLASEGDFALTASVEDTKATLLEARRLLSAANVPAGDRFLAASPEVVNRLLATDEFTRVDASGSDNALRDATVGRIYGFTVVESNALTAGTAVAYHRSGFVFANRVPVMPRGAASSATATAGGIGLRHIFQYDPNTLSDASVVSTFAGAAVVDAARVVKLTTAAA